MSDFIAHERTEDIPGKNVRPRYYARVFASRTCHWIGRIPRQGIYLRRMSESQIL